MNATLLTALIAGSVTVLVAVITSLVAPRITGNSTITITDRDRLEKNWTRTDNERIEEIQALKGENTTLKESHDELARRCDETERSVALLTTRVELQEATIIKQNGKLSERDVEIASLKQQVIDLRDELLEAYRRINDVQRAQRAAQ